MKKTLNKKPQKPQSSAPPKKLLYPIDFSHKFDEKDVISFKEIFIFFDRDADGLILSSDLGTALRSLGFLVSTLEIIDILKIIDPQKEGKISLKKFFDAISKVYNNKDSKEILDDAFDKLVKNNKPVVEKQDKPRKSLNKNKPTVKADEFKQLLTTLGDILNPWEVDFIYQNLTINKDNTIDVSEFKNLLLIPHI